MQEAGMFETSIVRVRAAAAPRRVGLLSASIGFHSLIVIAAVAVTVTSVDLPRKAPNEMELFRPIPVVSLPPALGTPHPAPRPAAPATPRPTPPVMVTAPAMVPDVVEPLAASVATVDPAATSSAGGPASTGRPDGVAGGVGDSEAAAGPVTDAIMVPGGEVRPAVVLQRVDPIFPRAALQGRMNGTVVVRCVIGKDGTCREPEIVSSTFAIFNQPAIDAVQRWRFAPGSYRGQIVDTYFELTVRFNVR
jgi:protein TonB